MLHLKTILTLFGYMIGGAIFVLIFTYAPWLPFVLILIALVYLVYIMVYDSYKREEELRPQSLKNPKGRFWYRNRNDR